MAGRDGLEWVGSTALYPSMVNPSGAHLDRREESHDATTFCIARGR